MNYRLFNKDMNGLKISCFKYCILVILIVTLIMFSGCLKRNHPINEPVPEKISPIQTTIPVPEKISPNQTNPTAPTSFNWLHDGPIYQTHPYYYNGKFSDITANVQSIADLGVKTVYLMPIWEQPGVNNYNFVYHIKDYYKVNPIYGTPDELKELVNTVHKYNMKIVFDLITCCAKEGSVFWNNNWMLTAPMSDLERFNLKVDTKDNNKYVSYNCNLNGKEAYCDIAGMLKEDKVIFYHYPHISWGYAIDRTNPEVIKYYTDLTAYYVKEYDIDGWRLDAPTDNYNTDILTEDHSNLKLLRSVKKAIAAVKPDSVLIAENPSAISAQKLGRMPAPTFDEMCDAAYSYPFQNGVINFKTTSDLMNFFATEQILYGKTRIRHLETHDSQRINAKAPQLNKILLTLISTIPGVPFIQAGQEIGAKNDWIFSKSDPKVNWDGDNELRNFYKKVFKIRNNNSALKYGTIENIVKSGGNSIAYMRSYGNQKVIVLLNRNDKKVTSTLDLSFLNKGVILYDELNDEQFAVNDPNNFEISIPAYGSRILVMQ